MSRTGSMVGVILAAVALLAGMGGSAAYVGRGGEARLGSGLSIQARQKLDGFLDAALTARIDLARRPSASLAVDCLFASELVLRGDARFRPYLDARVRALLAAASRSADGSLTWGLRSNEARSTNCPAGGQTSFGRAACDPPATAYAFQSGLAMACLGRAAEASRRPDLVAIGNAARSYWLRLATYPGDCGGCVLYPYSDVPADRLRSVRNTNIYLTLGIASLAHAGLDDGRTVERGLAAEAYERRVGNRGYFGAQDAQWRRNPAERERTENHMAGMAVALLAVHYLTRSPAALDLALWDYAVWRDCRTSACLTRPCSFWGADSDACAVTMTFVHCGFRRLDASARAGCENAIERKQYLSVNEVLFILAGD